ncbi:MAG TPA: dual specificity protein phosphatase family protein [Chlamydiales bacterium]|jgi:atypical dual specificity phosphatase|nr:dual specificity protein phosphatase family protein [Chlamydiales bacterium]
MFIFKRKLDPWEDELADKAKQTYSKMSSNPLFWASCALLAIALFFGYVLTGPSLIFLLGAATVALNIGRAIYRHWKEIFYESSLLFIAIRNLFNPEKYPWWNEIDDKLLLGAIPIQEKDHLNKIQAGAILTLLEEFEIENRWPFTTAISSEEWEKKKVQTLRISAVDIEGVTLKEIEQGVAFIRQQILKGRTVYVHCKAGIGRSATVIACYLLKYGLANGKKFHSPEEVFNYVLKKRGQARLHEPHRKAAIERYFSSYCL